MNSAIPSRWTWVLNPDADLEAGTLGPYQTTKKSEASMLKRRSHFASLVGNEPHYFVCELRTPISGLEKGSPALFWSPTPHAVRAAREAGLTSRAPIPRQCLQRIFHKNFLGQTGCTTLGGRRFVSHIDDFEQLHRQGAQAFLPRTQRFRLKRPYGFAGRGQLCVGSELSVNDRRWIADGLRSGGLVVEPEVENARTLSLHGLIAQDQLFVGKPCEFSSDPYGAPLGPEKMRLCPMGESSVFRTFGNNEAEHAAMALRDAGYEGPFGLDFLVAPDTLACIDLNPRFTLAWSLGMGALRDEAIRSFLRTST